jgi:hypothetical protein
MQFLILYDEGAHDTSAYLDRQKHSHKIHFPCDVMLGDRFFGSRLSEYLAASLKPV